MRTCNCVGILLAGGLARPMGGSDKVLRKIGRISFLAYAAAALRPQCAGLVLSANGDQARFAGFDIPVVADNVPGFKGPLAGILAGLIGSRCTIGLYLWRSACLLTRDWPIDRYDPFFNANYPSDLAVAEAILSRRNKRIA